MPEVEGTGGADPVSQDLDDGDHHVDGGALSPAPARQRTRQGRPYRRGSAVLALLGTLALVGAIALPHSRSVLVAFGATGLFGAALLRYVRPGQPLGARVGESVYAALAQTGEELVADLDLSNQRIYVPTAGGGDGSPPARLFVPAERDAPVPGPDDPAALSVGDADHFSGITVRPSGAGLYREFVEASHDPPPTQPAPVASQVTDALSNRYELVEGASMEVGRESVTFTLTGCVYGDLGRFDHPVASFPAVCLVAALDAPVSVDVAVRDAGDAYSVTCTWLGRDGSFRPT